MELTSTIEEIIKKKYNAPTLLLFILIYLFTIDFITIFLLGYQSRDFFILLDFQKILYTNIVIIIFFSILRKITNNAFWESAIVIAILTMVYSLVYGDFSQVYNLLVTIIFFLIIFTIFSYDYYTDNINNFEIPGQVLSVVVVFLSFSLLLIILIGNSVFNWKKIYSANGQLTFDTKITFKSLFESKSFNTYRLHKSYVNTKVYIDKEIGSIDLFKSSNDKFIQIPYDGYKYKDDIISVNYYDNGSYRIFFILNTNSCKEDNSCSKLTILTKQIHSHDTSKGYDFVSSYTHEVSLSTK